MMTEIRDPEVRWTLEAVENRIRFIREVVDMKQLACASLLMHYLHDEVDVLEAELKKAVARTDK